MAICILETHLLKLPQGNKKLIQLIMRLSIFVVTPVHPQGFAPKICPHSGLLHPNFCQGGFVGVGPEMWASLSVHQYKHFFATFRIFMIIARIGD